MAQPIERLAELGIEPLQLPGQERHVFFVRGEYAALVERTREGALGKLGTAGRMTERGLAMLMWRDGAPRFVGKGYDEAAAEEQVAALRAFTADLEGALRG